MPATAEATLNVASRSARSDSRHQPSTQPVRVNESMASASTPLQSPPQDTRVYSASEVDMPIDVLTPINRFQLDLPNKYQAYARIVLVVDKHASLRSLSFEQISDPEGYLERALRRVLPAALYQPAKINGESVDSYMIVEITTGGLEIVERRNIVIEQSPASQSP